MNIFPRKTTPERKKKFVQQWLENHLQTYWSNCPKENIKISTLEDNQELQQSFAATAQSQNPPSNASISNKKRLALSPIIGSSKKNFKRIKVVKKLSILEKKKVDEFKDVLEDTKNAGSSIILSKPDKQESIVIKNINNKSIESKNNENESPPFLDDNFFVNKDKSFCNFDHKQSFRLYSQETAQLIESTSSDDKSIGKAEAIIQEINSDTDKTDSDLIEEVEVDLITSSPLPEAKQMILSQNISSPSSTSSNHVTDVLTSESLVVETQSYKQQSLETLTITDPIDSASTFESRIDFSKLSYILQHTTVKQKKKNTKKGSLLDILSLAIAKEKSNVNILRHQLYKKSTDSREQPFILLQITNYLAMINNCQLIKCTLMEDTTNFLESLINTNFHGFVTIINVPEISLKINVNEKPALKIYRPWIMLDFNQKFIHITRFIAIPSIDDNNMSSYIENTKLKHEFSCPCINENLLSNNCELKFCDSVYSSVKTVFNHV